MDSGDITQPRTVVVTPPPRLDMYAAADFKKTLTRSVGSAPAVITVDMSQVTYLDALPLAVVDLARHEADRHGTRLDLVGLRGQPRRFAEEWEAGLADERDRFGPAEHGHPTGP